MDHCKTVKLTNEISTGETCPNLPLFSKITFSRLRKRSNIEKNMNSNIFSTHFKAKLHIVLVRKRHSKLYIYYTMLMLCGAINPR